MTDKEVVDKISEVMNESGMKAVILVAVPLPRGEGMHHVKTYSLIHRDLDLASGIYSLISIADQAVGLVVPHHPTPAILQARRKELMKIMTGEPKPIRREDEN